MRSVSRPVGVSLADSFEIGERNQSAAPVSNRTARIPSPDYAKLLQIGSADRNSELLYYLEREERLVKKENNGNTPRRLEATKLPYAYFIMGVNQWRHIHDPVHQLKMETASARAAEKAAARKGPLPRERSPLDPTTGLFGTPTRMGPQIYRHDLKEPKKPTTSPLQIRDLDMCYRQEKRKPLVQCPAGFTANKEGGCYMEVAPAFTCLKEYFYENGQCVQHRELDITVAPTDKKLGGKGKRG
ncbi:hypothetical protein EPH_0012380 [Eimeria praecox]|uniref:Uncharacterized protein n=1 Tax=Eimeria praecox TaxID=51316 RepID=U6H0P8_9EIME|nr:hypothetical protein EPH_0012380 [Eimeria praecox]